MDKTILELRGLTYKYPSREGPVIDSLDLGLGQGEKIALLGRNGTGKSTLFSLMNGLLRPNSGEIFLDGKKIGHRKKDFTRLRKAVGLVFQDPETGFIAPSVEEEISFGPLNLGLSQKEVRSLVDRVLSLMGLEDFRLRPTHMLSGGEKKLVSIASSLALEPRIMVFDEPSSGLDNYNEEKFLSWLGLLEERGLSLIISTHDMDFAWKWADRVLILRDGKITRDGKVKEVLTDKELMEENKLSLPYLVSVSYILGLGAKGVFPRTIEELNKQINKGTL